MKAYVFPGQGSQSVGMRAELFDSFSEYLTSADRILGYSVKELCLKDPEKKLNLTQYTQPGLFIVNALSYLKKLQEDPIKPDFVAGHSLGEYNALFASGAFDFETGLKLVQKRGQLMSEASEGAMAAVIGLSEEKIVEFLKANDLEAVDIANLNAPTQIVVSGLKEDIANMRKVFKSQRTRCLPLKVSAAFHSRYMSDARAEFTEFIKQFSFSDLQIPVISNVTAQPYEQSELSSNLAKQITHSVRWTDSVRYLSGQGDMEYEEIGPGKILEGLIRKILE